MQNGLKCDENDEKLAQISTNPQEKSRKSDKNDEIWWDWAQICDKMWWNCEKIAQIRKKWWNDDACMCDDLSLNVMMHACVMWCDDACTLWCDVMIDGL